MSRYRIQIVEGRKYQVKDMKYGENTVAVFYDLDLTQKFIEYLNQRERLIDLIMKHVEEDIDIENV